MSGADLAAHLVASIHACCDARGDDDANREALIEECLQMPAAVQRDLIPHFVEQAQWFALRAPKCDL